MSAVEESPPIINLTLDVYTADQVAALLKVSTQTVYSLCHAGKIGSVRVGKSIRIFRKHLADYLAGEGPPKAA